MRYQTLLKQALLFKQEEPPTYSQIKQLYEKAIEFQEHYGAVFMVAKPRSRAKIVDEKLFFQFLNELSPDQSIENFSQLQNYLSPSSSREQSINQQGNSKSHYAKVFNQTLLYKKRGSSAHLFTPNELTYIQHIEAFVVVENAESFLTIEENRYFYEHQAFIYLGGQPNSLTREFLQTKELLFFVDFDIVSMNLYDDFLVQSKKLFLPNDLEFYFKERQKNQTLYKKQRPYLRQNYSPQAQYVIDLIKEHSAVVEQEVVK